MDSPWGVVAFGGPEVREAGDFHESKRGGEMCSERDRKIEREREREGGREREREMERERAR